ncbi:MAG TPA: hypothetical protein VFU02_05310 [Polyangiaceae bacterium]|nr:hypothetical protein [Polyangiaceae bacterium]
MWIRGWGWVLPALVVLSGAWGCSASDTSALNAQPQPPGHHGGQTGSLRPCSTPAFDPAPASIPTGDAAVVFHTGCSADADFKLTDANGEPVPFELKELDDGVVLVQTEEALAPGIYQVETPDGSQETVVVTDPAPLPSKLGVLQQPYGTCEALFTLTLDDAAEPYVPFMRLEYSVDGGARQLWFEYGTIETIEDAVWLEMPDLDGGEHQLEVFGTIAGESMGPDVATLDFSLTACASAEDDGGVMQCSLGRGATGEAGTGGGTALCLVGVGIALVLGRRRPLTRRR